MAPVGQPRCGICGSEVRYAVTRKGYRVAFDIDSTEDGEYALEPEIDRPTVHARWVPAALRETTHKNVGLYQRHKETCTIRTPQGACA